MQPNPSGGPAQRALPPTDPPTTPLAIIGGGITGLAAAHAAHHAGRPCVLLEAGPRWGGKIQTEQITLPGGADAQPFIIEAGPDAFLTTNPAAWQLALDLGLADQLLPTRDDRRTVYVLRRGRLVPLPPGLALIVPTRLRPFLRSPLLSRRGRLRVLLEPLVPRRRRTDDESVRDFVTRRLGQEALDALAEPLLSGIYSANPADQSMAATFARYQQMEREHGSLLRATWAARRAAASGAGQAPQPPAARPPSAFLSFINGMQTLVDALVARLTAADGVALRLNCALTHIEAAADGGYRLTLADGGALTAQRVLLTVPAYAAAPLLRPLAPAAAAALDQIRYLGSGTLSLAFRRADVLHPLDGFGIVIPRSAGRPLNAVTWTSSKFDHRAPAGHVLLRVFFGGARTPQMMALADAELAQVACSQLDNLLGIQGKPLFWRVTRWERANPQYDVGHLARVAAIEAALPPGISVAGSAYHGVGIPDCVATN